jgi:ribosomal protein S18 acetylase RimI-like enzyme
MDPSITVRPLVGDDTSAVAQIHLQSFSTSALTRLGAEAVRRNYESLHTGPHELVALGAFDNGGMLGFCYAGVFRGETSYFLTTNRWFLVRRVLTHPWLVLNPIFRTRLNLAVRLLRKPQRMTPPPNEKKAFGIQSIAVRPDLQGRGVGKVLLRATEEAARARGFDRMHLTVHATNTSGIAFYEASGWKKQPEGVDWTGVMVKALA